MVGTLSELVVSFGISSHWLGLPEVLFVSDLGDEFVDWFFENQIDNLSHPILVFTRAFFLLLEWTLTMGYHPCCFIYLFDVILQLGEHLNPRHEVPKVSWRVERQVLLESLPRSQPKLVARHCQLLYLIVCLPIALAIVLDRLILTFPQPQDGSIPSISWENGVWYLGTGSFFTDITTWATDLAGMIVLTCIAAVKLFSFSCRSSSYFFLALSVPQRSTLDWARFHESTITLAFQVNTRLMLLLSLSSKRWISSASRLSLGRFSFIHSWWFH
ncbi:hypothetical protein Acr_07g0010560 [Actinidia rufa]|uniref:Uncharacterized protein n=1 Tax=Actinidia rufa TaxID=165716 RepID=A0A7J0EWU3_9ERIC|nr:hypothetical protein Acr_07g0010560 [Actinidia rufa]